MGRRPSFWVLLAVAVAVGVLFFRVIQPFLLPLLLATVVTLILRPYYEWSVKRLWNYRGLTAALFTIIFLVVILLPIIGALYLAGGELLHLGKQLAIEGRQSNLLTNVRRVLDVHLSSEEWNDLKKTAMSSVQSLIAGVTSKTQALVANIIELVVGLVITCLALFYFLADGPKLLASARNLSPLDERDEEILFAEFGRVCRGVVLATLVCTFFQAVAAGIGFAIAGVERIWLLSVLTMLTAMIPFIGAAAVWMVVALGLFGAGSSGACLFLIIYGSLVVSSLDNLLRAYVLRDTAHLHPLVALISVLGAMQVMGLWGVFIGPMIASFFHSLLEILRDRKWDAASSPPPSLELPSP